VTWFDVAGPTVNVSSQESMWSASQFNRESEVCSLTQSATERVIFPSF
jgi:hypothetical protein